MTFTQLTVKSDIIGIFASGLCLLHCTVTPFLFMANTGLETHGKSDLSWWGHLDSIFLVLSFFAVYWSIKHTAQTRIKYAFGTLWALLSFLVLNEKLELFHVLEEAVFVPSIGLVALHFYNRRHCSCRDNNCCVNN